jgi:hypothetical protein
LRIQGGTCGIISAILFGRLDPMNGKAPREFKFRQLHSEADRRARDRRFKRQAHRAGHRNERFAELPPGW